MLIDKLRDSLQAREELVAAWLFGSQATGRTHPGSDVDVAVLADAPLTLQQRLDLQMEIEHAVQRFSVDLVDLRCATPILAFEALNGVRLFVSSPEEVAVFSSLVGREYESAMALIKRGYRDRKDRVKATGMG